MKRKAKSQSRKPKKSSSRGGGNDAVSMLQKDHQNVLKLFKQFQDMAEEGESGEENGKSELVKAICEELKVHTTLEEEIFYPAVRAAVGEELIMDEALVEHESAKTMIEQLEGMHPGDEHYDAKVVVLGEYIKHHVQEEQGEIFPKVKKSKEIDLTALGEELATRKRELTGDASQAM